MTDVMTDVQAPRHRGLFWSAVGLALIALVGGSLVAYRGYAATSGPDGVVRDYFAALARSDAPAALGLGELPDGPHTLLTSTVLREQQRIAPISDVQVAAVATHGDRASVTVRYRLGFAAGTRPASDVVPVYRRDSVWRLSRTAAGTELRLTQAVERATVAGGPIPDGTVLLFPGAVPIGFDTPYLELDPASAQVGFATNPETDVLVRVSAAGTAAARAVIGTALRACVSAGSAADPRCPLPSGRCVPGSLRGRLTGSTNTLDVRLEAAPAGVIGISGTVAFRGSYRVLDFDNIASSRSGTAQLQVDATVYAIAPLTLRWSSPS